jgi:hypothetical protein
MSNSDLHTTAISTGGTSFDTATCIGGKCQYPLIESGVNAKVYYHNMICTQNKYEKLPFNTTLETYNASTKPNGRKPERSPFDDDATASYVGDFNINPMGNGLVSFQRVFAQVPEDHIEPYGLYSRQLPSYTTTEFNANASDFDSLVLKEQYSVDGSNWTDRTTASLGDGKLMGSTIDGETGVTVNDATLDWTDYTYVRLQWQAVYTGSVNPIPVGSTIKLKGDYDNIGANFYSYHRNFPAYSGYDSKVYLHHWKNVLDSYSFLDEVKRYVSHTYFTNYVNTTYEDQTDSPHNGFQDELEEMGDLTIREVTGSTGNQTITATTPPYNLSQWHTETERKNFGGMHIGIKRYSKSYTSDVYFYYLKDQRNNDDSATTLLVPAFTRSATLAENCPAHIAYTYVRTDEPENIKLQEKEYFPVALSDSTIPTTAEYLSSKDSNIYYNAENQFIERYMGNIYRLGQIRTTLL